eukprot:202061_1
MRASFASRGKELREQRRQRQHVHGGFPITSEEPTTTRLNHTTEAAARSARGVRGRRHARRAAGADVRAARPRGGGAAHGQGQLHCRAHGRQAGERRHEARKHQREGVRHAWKRLQGEAALAPLAEPIVERG